MRAGFVLQALALMLIYYTTVYFLRANAYVIKQTAQKKSVVNVGVVSSLWEPPNDSN